MNSKLILASKSPRRKQLLEWAEIPFEIVTQDTIEDFPSNLSPEEVPVFIARNKAIAVENFLQNQSGPGILAADTVVVLANKIIGKPTNKQEAISILQELSGATHRVITGVVMRKLGEEIAFADITEVAFHELTLEQITYYVDNYAPYDKAGAYAIQEWIGVVGIKWINGDFYNVMGLPVSRVVSCLQKW